MIPFVGRLTLNEWLLIFLVYTEKLLSIFVSIFVPRKLTKFSQYILNLIIYTIVPGITNDGKGTSNGSISKEELKLINSKNIKEMLELLDPNLKMEEHIVTTKDGYLLTLHRIPPRNINANGSNGVIYLHHGLLMCSDIWLCHTHDDNSNRERNLPLYLYYLKNYDIWLGNNRGNKYSAYHVDRSINEEKFWDFSIDEFAMFDIPSTIDYILNITHVKQINSIIAFSQGSAQIFASLSLHPELNSKINNFIALAPAMTPPGLYNPIVDTLMKTSPQLIYLFFGKKILLPSANTIWSKALPLQFFIKSIKLANKFLFNWESHNINKCEKVAYLKLYSPTSVKCVVHWFQILNAQKFQMFQDISSRHLNDDSLFNAMRFPTKTNIKIPVLLIYGETDSLVGESAINIMMKNLPESSTFKVCVKNHEHLDIIWGDDVDQVVYPHVLKFIEFWNSNSEDITAVNTIGSVNDRTLTGCKNQQHDQSRIANKINTTVGSANNSRNNSVTNIKLIKHSKRLSI
ncbi:sterol esterase SCDLUD_003983 [Saccharomycodes ludwigii]|uniref:sterol esterase n=1 Tax=Saccharomycodes ludwigii TaxID=36035 RepID=UPI001E830020|nr:hypothetical protein SCDLUD_003983 [Saccharomycodes ludwigii]KAH3899698.1 hypothetical protein SCDLUD_003983 [Saccharomycodes ludwigii]